MAGLRGAQGRGLRILSESSSSAHVADMKRRLLAGLPEAKWYEYEAISADNVRLGSELAFGAGVSPELLVRARPPSFSRSTRTSSAPERAALRARRRSSKDRQPKRAR